MLMLVVQSVGSSPGRKGFAMFVADDGAMYGSIGGGVMEHKLVELARERLRKGDTTPFLKRQIHQSNIAENRSGMICSGEQTVAFYLLEKGLPPLTASQKGWIFTEKGIIPAESLHAEPDVVSEDLTMWRYRVSVAAQPQLYIIGGGHVGLALSNLMKTLDFHITVLDHREGLNTMEQNTSADEKKVVNFDQIGEHVSEGAYVVLVSFGYRTDKQCMEKLIGRDVAYFGVMGSQAKMDKLMEELSTTFPKEQLDRIYTPIGIPIGSKTPEEIAVSIAAEVIRVRNT